MSARVELSDSEVERCKEIAEQMAENKRRHNVTDRRVDQNHSSESLDTLWITSELAVAKFLGIPYNPEMLIGGDNHDLDYRGYKLEVKAIWFNKDPLFKVAEKHLHKDWDVGVLVRHLYGFQKFDVLGYIGRNDFDHYGEVKTFITPMKFVHLNNMQHGEFLRSI